jgi:uncharacterized Zn-finger protein
MGRIVIIRAFPAIEDTTTKMDGTAASPTPTEIIHVDERVVACDGGPAAEAGASLGHPRVFLHIEDRSVMCPYCSRLYVLNEGAGHDTGN